jgi:hypothetical protein
MQIVTLSHLNISATEQPASIKFCVLLHKCSETLQMLQELYGKGAEKKMQVYEWHKHFHDGCGSVNDDLRYQQLHQLIKALSMCAMLCKVTEKKGI